MTSCQHGQSQRQCPLCERDETIADLRNDVLRVTMERDALRAEVERLRNKVADMRANWQRQIAMHEEDRARLAAAEKSVEALRAIDGLVVLRGSDIARNEAALAAFDAAKETNTP